MYYIKVEKQENCSKCKFSRPYYATTEDMTEFNYLCNLLGVVCSGTINPHNCPIKELKPKELKFTKYSENVWLCGNFNFLYKKKAKRYYCYYNFRKIDEAYSVKDSIKYCQEFANKLFYEMIGE